MHNLEFQYNITVTKIKLEMIGDILISVTDIVQTILCISPLSERINMKDHNF